MRSAARDTRARIVKAALPLFCDAGFDSTTVGDIAAEIGVTSAALYYHYDSKDAILVAVVEPLLDAIDEVLASAPGVDGTAESRRVLLDRFAEALIHARPLVCFVVQDLAVLHHPKVGRRLHHQQERLQALLAGPRRKPALVAATAATGAVWRPVINLSEQDLRLHRQTIVDAAVRALGAALP